MQTSLRDIFFSGCVAANTRKIRETASDWRTFAPGNDSQDLMQYHALFHVHSHRTYTRIPVASRLSLLRGTSKWNCHSTRKLINANEPRKWRFTCYHFIFCTPLNYFIRVIHLTANDSGKKPERKNNKINSLEQSKVIRRRITYLSPATVVGCKKWKRG